MVAALLLVPALFDAIRYLKSDADRKQSVQAQNSFPVSSATEIILVYNAWGGIYPGLVDLSTKNCSLPLTPATFAIQPLALLV